MFSASAAVFCPIKPRRFAVRLAAPAVFMPSFPRLVEGQSRAGSGSQSGFVTSFSGFVTRLLPLFFGKSACIPLN
jgi:hypothetical protein